MKKVLLVFLIAVFSIGTLQAKRTKIKITEYTVQSGDTLFIIARKHHTTTDEVRKNNSLEKNQLIRVGQILRVPTNTYFPKSTQKHQRKQLSKMAKKTNQIRKKGKISYTIAKGDTLFTIARKHHTTTQEVRDANGMERNTLIRVGQVITVPVNTYFPKKQAMQPKLVQAAPQKGKVDYSIEKGDTLFVIARKHHTTVKELLAANGMHRNALIRVGQVLHVPTNTYFPEGMPKTVKTTIAQKKPKQENGGIYTIQSGDTLFSIAKKNHVTLKEIMILNEIKAGSVIRVGQKLRVSKKRTFVASKKTITMPKQYKTKRGDTLYKIAKREGISVKKLKALNLRLKKVKNIHSRLKTNMVLAVEKARKVVRPQPKTYRVKKGDTLWLIAKKHHTTVKKLRALNKIARRTKLYKGMVLAVNGKRIENTVKISKQHFTKTGKAKKYKKTKIASSKKRRKSNSKRLSSAMALLNGKSGRSASRGSSHVIRIAKRYLGTRYVWGAQGPNRFDCSGFTQYVIRKSKGVRIPRVSRKQAYYGRYVSRSNLRAGDLIFFDTSRRRRGYVNHVGIYIGGSKFIHASSAKHRVVISSLNRPFYNARFKWGRRVN